MEEKILQYIDKYYENFIISLYTKDKLWWTHSRIYQHTCGMLDMNEDYQIKITLEVRECIPTEDELKQGHEGFNILRRKGLI